MKTKAMTAVFTMIVVVLFAAVACQPDDFSERFSSIAIGDSKERVLEVMGTAPSSASSIDVPLVALERMVWVRNGKTYLVYMVAGRVVSKTALAE